MILQLTLFLSSLFTLALIHNLATKFFLYWKYPWLDIPVHVLGGICVALGVSVLPFFRIHFVEKRRSLFWYLGIVIVTGIVWEIFEIAYGIMVIDDEFFFDTTLDLVMDMFGGVLGYGMVQRLRKL